ncbi:MAG: hypothetical protein JW732_09710 [Dehalococcoidia bacterium]|nr:hypothetical protein [Dehalococcoidia bacterium]
METGSSEDDFDKVCRAGAANAEEDACAPIICVESPQIQAIAIVAADSTEQRSAIIDEA